MKRSTLFIALTAIMFALNANAQDGNVYLKFNAGYNLPLGSQNFSSNYSSKGDVYSYEAVYGSLGKGFNIDASLGYMFNKNLGMELGLSYLLGSTIESSYHFENLQGEELTDLSSYKSNMLRINPSIIIQSGGEGINPYAKFGFILGIGCVTMDSEYTNNFDGNTNLYTSTTKLNGGISFGANAALGAYYPINDKVSLFGELTFVSMSYAPKKGEVTAASQNGIDILSWMTTRGRETNFVKEYYIDYNDSPDVSEPSTSLIEKLPFGSFGINFGIKIGL